MSIKLDEFFKTASGGCMNPGCTHKHDEMFYSSSCHPGQGVELAVDAKKRTIRIGCAVCHESITTVECPFMN